MRAPKAIVFLSCLLQLFTRCQVPGCSSTVDPANIDVQEHGAVIVVKYVCNEHHTGEWSSSPFIGEGRSKVGVLNIILATFSLTCGLHISQVLRLQFKCALKLIILLGFGVFFPPPNLYVWADLLLQPTKEPVGEGCLASLVRMSGKILLVHSERKTH